jgi:hypothetical protein
MRMRTAVAAPAARGSPGVPAASPAVHPAVRSTPARQQSGLEHRCDQSADRTRAADVVRRRRVAPGDVWRVAGGFARRYARGNPTETAAATERRRLGLCTTWAPPRATIGHCRCAGVLVCRRATALAWRAWSCGSRPRYGQARLVLCAHSCVLALSCTPARRGEQARVLAGTAERPPLEDLGGPSRLRRERAARIVGRERLG